MSLSWAAVAILLLLVGPGLSFLFWIRLAFPRSTFSFLKDVNILIAGMVLSAALNGNLFGYIGRFLYDPRLSPLPTDFERRVVELALDNDYHPWRPAIRIAECIPWLGDISRTNPTYFLFDLYLRPFLAGMILAILSVLASKIIDRFYSWRWNRIVAEGEHPGKAAAEKASERGFINRIRIWIHQAFLHPWALLTVRNGYRDLLMVDVLTKQSGMYCGLFTSYVPDGNTISAVSMEYCVVFEPKPIEAPIGSPRAKRMIKNNGTVVIPSCEIVNLHFWELRRGFRFLMWADNPTWFDVLCQNCTLASLYPKFVNRIVVYLGMPKSDRHAFLRSFKKFADSHGIQESLVKFILPAPGSYKEPFLPLIDPFNSNDAL